MITTTTKVTVHPESEPLYSERGYTIEIEDEAAGPFIALRCMGDRDESGTVFIDPADWPALRNALDAMIQQCQKLENPGRE